MPQIKYNKIFVKKLRKFLLRHPDLKDRTKKALEILEQTPDAISLKNHKLTGNMDDYCAISITFQYRIVFLIDNENCYVPIGVGSHDEMY